MKRTTRKNIITVICLALAFSPVISYAANRTGRAANIQSKGTVQYTDGTNNVVISSQDLIDIANEIDVVEASAKEGQVAALQSIGSLDGVDPSDVTFSQINEAIRMSQTSSNVPSPSELLSDKEVWANGSKITGTMKNNGDTGISDLIAGSTYIIPEGYTLGGTVTTASLESQTGVTGTYIKDDDTEDDLVAATSDNLSLGTAAWVDGQYIVGTGADNINYQNQGYSEGYAVGYSEGYAVGYAQGYAARGDNLKNDFNVYTATKTASMWDDTNTSYHSKMSYSFSSPKYNSILKINYSLSSKQSANWGAANNSASWYTTISINGVVQNQNATGGWYIFENIPANSTITVTHYVKAGENCHAYYDFTYNFTHYFL